jgi:integrase
LAEGIPDSSRLSLYDYLAGFWSSQGEYARLKALAGRPLAAEYLANNHGAIQGYVLPYLEQIGKRNLPLASITAALLQGLVLHLHDTTQLRARRINGIRQAVAVPLAEAKRLGRLHFNPMGQVLKLRETKKPRQILSTEEARAVLAGTWPDERYRLINLLAVATGMRLGECRALRVENLVQDGEFWCIRVVCNWQDGEGLKPPKWGSSRLVPISSRLAGCLLELAGKNPWHNGFVFYGSSPSSPVAKRAVEQAFNAAVRAAGISEEDRVARGLTFHSWRHWLDSYLRGKIPDHALQALTGHRTQAVAESYSHVTEEQRQQMMKLTDGLF